jgi:hypothetical protein
MDGGTTIDTVKGERSLAALSLRVRSLADRLAPLARRHWLIIALVALGLLVRVLVMVAYHPAFWFTDSRDYLQLSWEPLPSRLRPNGYPAVLTVLRHLGPVALVVMLQHLVVHGLPRHGGARPPARAARPG